MGILPSFFFLLQLSLLLTFLTVSIEANINVSNNNSCSLGGAACGGVQVEYPFGIGDGCSLNPGFQLQCQQDVLYIPGRDRKIAVLGISESRVLADSSSSAVFYCQTLMNSLRNVDFIHLDQNNPFTFPSDDSNKLVAIGCNTVVTVEGNEPAKSSSCSLACDEGDPVIDVNTSCSGKSCCQISLPATNKTLLYFISRDNASNRSSVVEEPCSYGFVTAGSWAYNYSLSGKSSFARVSNATMNLDWAVGMSTCEEAMRSAGYACGPNSACVDAGRGYGYLCRCSHGYKGNPYLGCQDIDECKDSSDDVCAPEARCINKSPGFVCRCPIGSLGNGLRGHGCNNRLLVILASTGSVGAAAFCCACCYVAWKRRNERAMYFRQNGGLLLNQHLNGTASGARIFRATELKKATNNYDSSRILGRGGQGTVYKGILDDGCTVVAVKKSQGVDQSHVDQFINELVILSRVHHKNIVKLLGFCLETEVPLLVYEFVSNGTLREAVVLRHHDITAGGASLYMVWEDTIRMANEIAQALSYLHNHSTMPIFHRDVKSSNILVDENRTVKLADFGISRLVAPEKVGRVSTSVRGTVGYLDPEYLKSGKLTEKSDVFSFGVVLLELLTCLKPVRHEQVHDYSSLVIHFLSYAKEGDLLGIFDETILQYVKVEELQALSEIARSCLAMKGDERPTIKKVAEELDLLSRRSLNIST